MTTRDTLRRAAQALGRKGGQARSAAKRRAAAANLKKARAHRWIPVDTH